MHLQDHPGIQAGFYQRVRKLDHGDLHDVGGRTLDRGVDRFPFRPVARVHVQPRRRAEFREIPAPAEHGFDKPLQGSLVLGVFHKVADAGESFEIGGYEFFGFGKRHIGGAGQPEGGLAVKQPEVDRLGMPPHRGRDLRQRHSVHRRRRRGVDILAAAEGFGHPRVLRHVRRQAQFDLGIIDRQQAAAGGAGERAAQPPAFLGPGGDILQIWVGGGNPSGDGPGLVVGGVHAAGDRIDLVAQGDDVSGEEFGKLAVPPDQLHHRVLAGQAVEHIRGGGIFAGRGFAGFVRRLQLQLAEERVRQLLGGI